MDSTISDNPQPPNIIGVAISNEVLSRVSLSAVLEDIIRSIDDGVLKINGIARMLWLYN